MAFKKIPLTIDTMIRNPVPIEGINQEDNIELNIVVTENKTPKDLSSQTIKVYVRRIDGTLVEQTNQITPTNARKGEVTVKLKNSAFNKEGYALFQLDISDSSGRITSSYATFKVGKGLVSSEAIANTNEVNALKQIEEYVLKANKELETFKQTVEDINREERIRRESELLREQAEEKRNEKIKEFNKRIDEEEKRFLNLKNKNNIKLNITFKKGSLLTTNGQEIASEKRIVSNFIQLNEGEVDVFLENYNCKFMLFSYSKNTAGEVSLQSYTEWGGQDLTLRAGVVYKILLAYNDDREINDVEELAKTLKFNEYIKKTLLEKEEKEIGKVKTKIEQIENQIPSMMSECVKFKNILNFDINFAFQNLNISNGMVGGASTTRIISEIIEVKKNESLKIKPKGNIKFIIVTYNEMGEFENSTGWNSEKYEKIYDIDSEIRIILAYKNDDVIPVNYDYKNFVEIEMRKKVKGKFIESTTLKPNDKFQFKIGSVNTVTGIETINNTRISTEITLMQYCDINIEPIEGSKFLVVTYDTNMEVLNSTQWQEVNTNIIIAEPVYIKILFAYKDNRVVSEEDIVVLSESIKSIINKNLIDSENVNNYYFKSPKLEAIKVGKEALGYNEFINEYWEKLRGEYSSIITRNEIIRDTSDTFSIYEYIITPKKYTKTVFITAGMHGDEYEGFYGLYYFIENIIRNGYKYAQLRDISHEVRFVVIPVLNPYGVQNKTRATSRIPNANNNYDVMFYAKEYEHDGASPFSENESKAVKIIADKYEGELDLYFDFHTDFYDPQNGDYILLDALSSNRDISVNLTIDEIKKLKDNNNFVTEPKPNIVNINKRCSSFKYMDIVRKIPSAIIEVGTGRISPIGSSESITRAVEWYTNVVCEHLRKDYKKNEYNKNLENAICEGRMKSYAEAFMKNISDEGLQLWLDYNEFNGDSWVNKSGRGDIVIEGITQKEDDGVLINKGLIKLARHSYSDYTIFIKGKILSDGTIISSEGTEIELSAVVSSESNRYNIIPKSNPLYCSLLKYNDELTMCIRNKGGIKELFVNGEPFSRVTESNLEQSELFIGARQDKSNPVNMKLKNILLYDKALKDEELGFIFKSI